MDFDPDCSVLCMTAKKNQTPKGIESKVTDDEERPVTALVVTPNF